MISIRTTVYDRTDLRKAQARVQSARGASFTMSVANDVCLSVASGLGHQPIELRPLLADEMNSYFDDAEV
jgi:hypothetical protein